MKILEKKDWTKVFSHVCTCTQCESKLDIETDDLTHQPATNDEMYVAESFYVSCPVCWFRITIPINIIPPYIQKLTRSKYASNDDR